MLTRRYTGRAGYSDAANLKQEIVIDKRAFSFYLVLPHRYKKLGDSPRRYNQVLEAFRHAAAHGPRSDLRR
jgi:hypothetical protein